MLLPSPLLIEQLDELSVERILRFNYYDLSVHMLPVLEVVYATHFHSP
jgi:hypothetical protein